MREFFHGWRRKVGCVTSLMALAFTAGWVRSCTSTDFVIIPTGPHSQNRVYSMEQAIVAEMISSSNN